MPCLELQDRLEIPSLTGLPYVPSVKASCLHLVLNKGTEVHMGIMLGLVLFMSCMKDHKLLITVE